MGQVERDPFPQLVRLSDGINQHQDPGLDEETRTVAMRAVRHCLNRDVFYLDGVLASIEHSLSSCNNRPEDTEYLVSLRDGVVEEMLSHGCR